MFFPAYIVKENDIVSFKRCGKIKIGKVLRYTKSGKIVVNVKNTFKEGVKMKVAFYTLGCKVNQYETDIMIKEFMDKGYEVVKFTEKANIYVINSCSVTNMSTRKTRQYLSRAKIWVVL